MSSHIAERYARAILELGIESGTVEPLVAEISTLAAAYETSEELRQTLSSPLISPTIKEAIVRDLTEKVGASSFAKNAILLLNKRGRLSLLGEIARTLRAIHDAQQGVVHAEVTSAVPLNDAQCAQLVTKLEQMTGKRITLERHEDSSLLGGIVTRIGDTMIDGSIKGQLETMRRKLMPD